MLESVEIEVGHGFKHGDLDLAADAAAVALMQRTEDTVGRVEARHRVGDRRAQDARVGRARYQQEEVVAKLNSPISSLARSAPRTTMVLSFEVQIAERGTVALPIFK